MENLIKEINKFRNYANKNKSNYGEWEMYYNNWDNIYTSFINVLKNEEPTKKYVYDMIYIIARDNECEYIIEELTEYKYWFELLCKYSLKTNEYNAKWQFAHYLSEYVEKYNCNEFAKESIIKFLEDKNEYVSRRALLVLHKILPEKIENYANIFWYSNINNELKQYQIMAILEALYNIKSPIIFEYIEKAKKIDIENKDYLIKYITKIENKLINY